MSAGTINRDFQKHKEGLIYDAEGVILAGKYGDELSAHRGKRQWIEVFNNYFLLEQERDYEIWVTSSASDGYFVITCCFVSACGRYAFWRLVNQQAPEAEAKLGATVRKTIARKGAAGASGGLQMPYVLSGLDQSRAMTVETTSLLQRMLKLFK